MGNRVLSSMLLAALLSSCNGASSGNKENIDVVGEKKTVRARASCEFKFTEGGDAPADLPAQNIKASRFLKKYDASLMASVQGASGSETARFASLTGVTFYQVADLEIDERDCLFTQSLPEAPSPVLKYFRDAEDRVKGKDGGKSTLLGFYLDQERVNEISGANSGIGPVITVKNDSERYTMIHEFFHHVFDLSRETSGTLLQDNLAKSSQAVTDEATKYNDANTLENLLSYAKAFDQQSKDLVKVLKEYALEEMSIEYELNDMYQRNALKYVNYYSRLNGDFYTVSSAENAVSRIQAYEKMINSIDSVAQAYKKEGDISAVSAVTAETRKMFASLKNEIYSVARLAQIRVDAYKNSNNNISFNQDFLSKKTPKHKKGECNHDHGVNVFLDGVQSKTSQIKLKK
jgi:hypothetical protein